MVCLLVICVVFVCCGCQLDAEARESQNALLTELVQLCVQMRQVNRLVQRLCAVLELSAGRCVHFTDGFSARFVNVHCCHSQLTFLSVQCSLYTSSFDCSQT